MDFPCHMSILRYWRATRWMNTSLASQFSLFSEDASISLVPDMHSTWNHGHVPFLPAKGEPREQTVID